MELRHLRYFLAVAEELHFSRAAVRLNISQPPLSQQIRQLEDELGVELFHRTKRQVQLTEAGRVFQDEARRVLSQVDRAKRMAARTDMGQMGQLTVGTVTSIASRFHRNFVQTLRLFAKRYPDVCLEVRRLNTADQMKALQEGAIDVSFVTAAEADDEVAIQVLERAPLVVTLPEGHHLASRKVVRLDEVTGEPNIVLSRQSNTSYHDLLVSWCRERGCTLNVAHEFNAMHMGLTLVALGFGVSLVPGSFRDAGVPGVVFRRLQGPVPQIESGVAYRREIQTRTVREFLKVVGEVATRKPPSARKAAS